MQHTLSTVAIGVAAVVALLFAIADEPRRSKPDGAPAWTQSGRVSWYGPGFQGRRTANGEIFDTNEMTMAHRSLAFGSRVRVTNLENGRAVVVRVNDRGPYVRGRVADLSGAAAKRLDFVDDGVVRARIELL
jgi:rare lipoprotein A